MEVHFSSTFLWLWRGRRRKVLWSWGVQRTSSQNSKKQAMNGSRRSNKERKKKHIKLHHGWTLAKHLNDITIATTCTTNNWELSMQMSQTDRDHRRVTKIDPNHPWVTGIWSQLSMADQIWSRQNTKLNLYWDWSLAFGEVESRGTFLAAVSLGCWLHLHFFFFCIWCELGRYLSIYYIILFIHVHLKLSQVKQGRSKVQKSIYIPSSDAAYESSKALTSSTSSPPFLLVVWNNLPYTTFEVARKVLLIEPAIEIPFLQISLVFFKGGFWFLWWIHTWC